MRATVFKLTAFAAVCVGMTMYLALTIGNQRLGDLVPFRDSTYNVVATFDDVTGLIANDNVKIAGVTVGKVTGVAIDDGRARVTLAVRNGVRVPSDTSASVRWRNLLGQRYVYLHPGQASTVLEEGAHIRSTQSVVDLGELFNRLGPIVKAIDPEQVNTFLDAIVGALDGNEAQLRAALDNLAVLATTLGERDAAIGRLVENLDTVSGAIASRDQAIRTVLDNLLALATTFNEHADVVDTAITELGDFSSNLALIVDTNRAQLERIITNLATLVQTVDTKLPELDSIVANLDEASRRLFNASRYGEWLNQDIYCGRFFDPPEFESDCDPAFAGPEGAAAGSVGGKRAGRGTTGRQALLELLGAGSR